VQDNLQLLHVNEAAELLGCSRRHVYTLIAADKLRAVKLSTRATRIARTELERFIAKNTRGWRAPSAFTAIPVDPSDGELLSRGPTPFDPIPVDPSDGELLSRGLE
jgi:excisionase family DNA binding protein